MGPDCGTAIINGMPLGFANLVKKGPVGIVAASGTGIQEISSIIGRYGGGISHAIGLGGHDLTEDVGGIMMEMGIEALLNDDETKIIVLASKPPAQSIADKIIEKIKNAAKPCIINFLGTTKENMENITFCKTLEETAFKALEMLDIKPKLLESKTPQLNDLNGKYFTGLYTGGTLASEALLILSENSNKIYANIQKNKDLFVSGHDTVKGHNIIDLGEDEFTRGKPHPMIEPDERNKMLIREAKNSNVGAIIMDFVLGYGSHLDPVGAMEQGIKEARKINPNLVIIASITGTYEDPQNFEDQKNKLEKYGVYYFNTNAQAANFLKEII